MVLLERFEVLENLIEAEKYSGIAGENDDGQRKRTVTAASCKRLHPGTRLGRDVH